MPRTGQARRSDGERPDREVVDFALDFADRHVCHLTHGVAMIERRNNSSLGANPQRP
jgi:hypothetical protein